MMSQPSTRLEESAVMSRVMSILLVPKTANFENLKFVIMILLKATVQ